MATKQQQLEFIRTFQGYSESAATQLVVPSLFPLAQWALESGWGTESGDETKHNIAGLCSDAAGTVVASYPTWAHMVAAYVVSMRNDCPNIRNKETNANSPAESILEGTRYNTVDKNYVNEINGCLQDIESLLKGENTTMPTDLTIGSIGDVVRRLQTSLNRFDGAGLTVDGVYGQQTKTAVENFERKYNLVVDGIAGVKVEAEIAKLDEQPTPSPTVPNAEPTPSQSKNDSPVGGGEEVTKLGQLVGGLTGFQESGSLRLPLIVNGVALGNIEFDTGCEITTFSSDAASRLRLPHLGTVNMSGVDEKPYPCTKSECDIEINGTVYKNVECVIDPLWTTCDGLLGLNFALTNKLNFTVNLQTSTVEYYA